MLKSGSLVFTFIMPIGLGSIGWNIYMSNVSWDIVILGFIVRFCVLFVRPLVLSVLISVDLLLGRD
jgi:hypothetical protein